MALRSVLVALVLAATAAFVVGVAIERSSGGGDHHEAPATAPAAGGDNGGSEASEGAGRETAQEHTSEGQSGEAGAAGDEQHAELRPLGIDVEAWPFVALAALASLGLAAAAWLHPRSTPLLVLVALAMVLFTVLDVREVFHQADMDENGLAVLAGVVAALHAAAAVVAVVAVTMASRARHPTTAAPGSPGTMPA